MNSRIKIFTRSFDLRLYRYARGLFETLGYPCVRLTDQSADGYFRTILRDTECDIAINIDEDAFLTDPEVLSDLVRKVIEDGYANAGYPDATVISPARSSIVTNPFFNILNLNLIRTRYDRMSIREQNFEDAEPYYPFFIWLASEFKTLYLPCRVHGDGITTVACDTDGRPFCFHSWYARFYSMPSWMVRRIQPTRGNQKERIDTLIKEAYSLRNVPLPSFSPVDKCMFLGNKIIRWTIKVPQRVARWPWKVRRMMARRSR